MGSFQSGQMGQTVNLLSFDFGGSNPSLPTQQHRGSSSVDRASAFQAEGREFEPRLPLKDSPIVIDVHSRFFCALLQYATSKNTRGGMHSASRLGCIDYPKSRLC